MNYDNFDDDFDDDDNEQVIDDDGNEQVIDGINVIEIQDQIFIEVTDPNEQKHELHLSTHDKLKDFFEDKDNRNQDIVKDAQETTKANQLLDQLQLLNDTLKIKIILFDIIDTLLITRITNDLYLVVDFVLEDYYILNRQQLASIINSINIYSSEIIEYYMEEGNDIPNCIDYNFNRPLTEYIRFIENEMKNKEQPYNDYDFIQAFHDMDLYDQIDVVSLDNSLISILKVPGLYVIKVDSMPSTYYTTDANTILRLLHYINDFE